MKKLIVILIAVLLAPVVIAEQIDGPFGLKWGMTKAQVENLGVILLPKGAQGPVMFYKAVALPRNFSIAEFYSLSFDRRHNLQKIEMISKDISNDAFGTAGKEKYASIKKSLIKKYGNPTRNLESVGNSLYREPDEFYQCLAYDGCGMWASVFISPEQAIVLEIKGMNRGNGYIRLIYEGPHWNSIVDAAKNKETVSDENAL